MRHCITQRDVIPKKWCPLFSNYSQFILLPITLYSQNYSSIIYKGLIIIYNYNVIDAVPLSCSSMVIISVILTAIIGFGIGVAVGFLASRCIVKKHTTTTEQEGGPVNAEGPLYEEMTSNQTSNVEQFKMGENEAYGPVHR